MRLPNQQVTPVQLAFVGDAVYELHARTLFVWPLTPVRAHRAAAVELVRAETQSLHLRRLLAASLATTRPADAADADAEAVAADGAADAAVAAAAAAFVPTALERTLLRRGRNASGPGPSRLLDRSAYGEASALETLLGYLYLANDAPRLQALLDTLLGLAADPPGDADRSPVDWKALGADGNDDEESEFQG
jgi:ribonuclease-3 family protein